MIHIPIRWTASLVAAGVLLAIIAVGALSGGPRAAEAVGPLDGRVICLDPGHGGDAEPGAVNGILEEADINLDVSFAVRTELEAMGATVRMTRMTDVYLSTRDRYTFCNSLDVAADALVSVHTNSLADPARDGTFALYFKSEDKALAQAVHDAMWAELSDDPPHFFQDFGVRRDALGVLLKSNMPAVVAEPVMMSNPWEAAALATPMAACDNCRRQQIADTIVTGVVSYFATLPPGGDPGGGGDPSGGGKDEAFCTSHPGHPKCP